MTRARDLADSADKDIAGTLTLDGLTVAGNVSADGGTIKLDGNYPNGVNNVALGNAALDTASGANGYSVAIGTNALTAMTTGGSNTGVGYGAAAAINSGANNVAIGTDALSSATTSNFNTAVGSAALSNIDITSNSNHSTAVGYQAGYNSTHNVDAFGSKALYSNTTSIFCVGIGRDALFSNTTGSYNVAVGKSALQSNTTASNNTAVGYLAAYNNTTGTGNTALGYQAYFSSTTGTYNTSIGYQSMNNADVTGSYNVGIGPRSLYNNTTASNNTAVGYQALYDNTTGANNSSYGAYSLANNTTATGNTAVGYYSVHTNTTGVGLVGVGETALYANTTGSYNVALGQSALFSNTTASNNTAVGYQAGYSHTAAGQNTSIGYKAGKSTVGEKGTFVGESAGLNTTSGLNTFIGQSSGTFVTTGDANTILGRYNGNQGGLDIRTSSNNIVLSDGDGNPRIRTSSDGSIFFGPNFSSVSGTTGGAAFWNESANRKTLYLATTSVGLPLAYFASSGGFVGSISVSSGATSYNTTSDYRLKENVVDLTGATERLKQIPVHQFNFISDPNTTVDGFIAHEVQSIVPEAVHGTKDAVDADGNPVYQGIDQSKLVPLLVATIKELEARITALENA